MLTAKEAAEGLVELAGGDKDLAFKMFIDWLYSDEGERVVDEFLKELGVRTIGGDE